MKPERHSVIREIVASTPVASQHQLRRKLVRRGFDVTQATLSRDIRELRLYKGPGGYALPNGIQLRTPATKSLRSRKYCAASRSK